MLPASYLPPVSNKCLYLIIGVLHINHSFGVSCRVYQIKSSLWCRLNIGSTPWIASKFLDEMVSSLYFLRYACRKSTLDREWCLDTLGGSCGLEVTIYIKAGIAWTVKDMINIIRCIVGHMFRMFGSMRDTGSSLDSCTNQI